MIAAQVRPRSRRKLDARTTRLAATVTPSTVRTTAVFGLYRRGICVHFPKGSNWLVLLPQRYPIARTSLVMAQKSPIYRCFAQPTHLTWTVLGPPFKDYSLPARTAVAIFPCGELSSVSSFLAVSCSNKAPSPHVYILLQIRYVPPFLSRLHFGLFESVRLVADKNRTKLPTTLKHVFCIRPPRVACECVSSTAAE